MTWIITAPPAKTVANIDGDAVDVLAIRTIAERDGPQMDCTEFLVASGEESPQWIEIARIEDVNVLRLPA